MSKETGLGWTTLSVDDASDAIKDIKNDILSFNFATPRGVQDVTGIDKSAYERLLLLADFSISLSGAFNDATGKSHDVFKTVPSTSVARTTSLAISDQTLEVEVLYTDYPLTRGTDGSLVWSVPGVLADGNVPTWSA